MNKKVLLARPSPFIINEMKDFISQCNYKPIALSELGQLKQHKKEDLAGIVISTAIKSNVNESFNDTLKHILDTYANIPILIATLVPATKIKTLTDTFLLDIGKQHELKSIEELNVNDNLDFKNTFLILEKKALINRKKNYCYPSKKSTKKVCIRKIQ